MTLANLRLGGVPIWTGRDSLSYLLNPRKGDVQSALSGRVYQSYGGSGVESYSGTVVPHDDYLDEIGPVLKQVGLTPLILPDGSSVAVERLALTGKDRGQDPYDVTWRKSAMVRVCDQFGYGASLTSETAKGTGIVTPYSQQNSGAQAISSGAGLVLTGAGAWSVGIRESSSGRVAERWLNAEIHVTCPLASRAAIGLAVMSSAWATQRLGASGIGVDLNTTPNAVLIGAGDASGSSASRAGGTDYRIVAQVRGTVGRIAVYRGTTRILWSSALTAPSGILGLVASVHTGTLTLRRWWIETGTLA